MSSRYLISKELIPADGSIELIERFSSFIEKDKTELMVFPDVHYKKGARVTNGLLTAASDLIYPSMLGVTNCGFTFGRIDGANSSERANLDQSFEIYSKTLKAYSKERQYSNGYVENLFSTYLDKEFSDPKNSAFFSYLGVKTAQDLSDAFREYFPKNLISIAAHTLGTLGGGNHFFEIHYIEEAYSEDFKVNDVYFILHSDSIAVGDKVNLLFSNLSELHHLSGIKHFVALAINRLRQAKYFLIDTNIAIVDKKNIFHLLYSQEDFRSISSHSRTGRALLFNFFFASVFGEMNRDTILNGYKEVIEGIDKKYHLIKMGSHSHDSISVSSTDQKIKIVQRNGVQDINGSNYYCLPGALGTESYLMKNTNNSAVYFSANHGVGRMLDKHIAKEEFTEDATLAKLKSLNMKVYRVGKGNIREQNPDAFKNVFAVTEEMQEQNLGIRAAKLRPIASLKG